MAPLAFCLAAAVLVGQEPAADREKKLSFHFKDASVDAVLKYVSSITGWIFVQEKQVAGSITAVSDTEVPTSKVLEFLNAALRPVDAIITNPVSPEVPKSGQVLKVQDLVEAMRRNLRIFQGVDPEVIPISPEIRTQIVPLKAMNVSEVQKELGELLKKILEADGQVAVSTYSNALILTGRSDCIRNAVRVLRLIDVSTSSELKMQTFTLTNADAGEAAKTLNEVFNPGEATKAQQQMYAMQMGQQQKAPPARPLSKDTIRVVSETQTNSVIVLANDDNMAEIRHMIERLDKRGSATVKVKFYALKHSDATAVAKFIADLFSEPGSSGKGPSSGKSRGQLFVYDMYGRMVPHNESSGSALEVRVVADPRANKLVVAASEQRLIMIDAIVEELDQPVSDLIQLRIYKLRHAGAADTAAILKDLFLAQVKATQGGGQKAAQPAAAPPPGPGNPQQPQPAKGQGEGTALLPSQEMEITADARTSRVIVRASKEYLAIMDQVVQELDADPTESVSTFVIPLHNGDATGLAAILQNLLRGTPAASQVHPPTSAQQPSQPASTTPQGSRLGMQGSSSRWGSR
jgi:type II secretory pathway component GspD/PulD (secretin)